MNETTIKFIILNVITGKAVQTWSFADKAHIVYCKSPEWAMKFETMEDAQKRVEYLKNNFPSQKLTAMKFTKTVTYKVG